MGYRLLRGATGDANAAVAVVVGDIGCAAEGEGAPAATWACGVVCPVRYVINFRRAVRVAAGAAGRSWVEEVGNRTQVGDIRVLCVGVRHGARGGGAAVGESTGEYGVGGG